MECRPYPVARSRHKRERLASHHEPTKTIDRDGNVSEFGFDRWLDPEWKSEPNLSWYWVGRSPPNCAEGRAWIGEEVWAVRRCTYIDIPAMQRLVGALEAKHAADAALAKKNPGLRPSQRFANDDHARDMATVRGAIEALIRAEERKTWMMVHQRARDRGSKTPSQLTAVETQLDKLEPHVAKDIAMKYVKAAFADL